MSDIATMLGKEIFKHQMTKQENIELRQQLSDQQALIEKQAKVIEILKESNDFYADKYNWDDDNIDNIDTESRKEIYQEKELIFYEGGKKARLAQKQVEEILNG